MTKTKNKTAKQFTPSGLRVTPDIRKALKVAAIEQDRTMESLLCEIICNALDRPDLLADAAEAST